MTPKIQKEIQERLAKLLADSSLAEDLKKALLDNMDKIPDYHIFDLIDALEKEKIELQRIALDIKLYLEQQGNDWKELEAKQEQAADEIVDKEIQKIEDEFKLQQAKDSLTPATP
ncbi:MAG: hypothetical protein HYT63_02950 [Candidatus Yanofskybacteria bacterium]|nr:hypothetical protein [Candidatus Yanofskybacteria bacterium]